MFNKPTYFETYEPLMKGMFNFVRMLNACGLQGIKYNIIGGSVFSQVFNSPYPDIDFFLENEEDVEKMKNVFLKMGLEFACETENAITFNSRLTKPSQIKIPLDVDDSIDIIPLNKKFQIVTRKFGDFNTLCEDFDISSSMIGVNQDCELLIHDSYNDMIDVIKTNPKTLFRFNKYLEKLDQNKSSYIWNSREKSYYTSLCKCFDFLAKTDLYEKVSSFYKDSNDENITVHDFYKSVGFIIIGKEIILQSFIKWCKKSSDDDVRILTDLLFNNKTWYFCNLMMQEQYSKLTSKWKDVSKIPVHVLGTLKRYINIEVETNSPFTYTTMGGEGSEAHYGPFDVFKRPSFNDRNILRFIDAYEKRENEVMELYPELFI